MSGPKCAHVRPTPKSRVVEARTELRRLLLVSTKEQQVGLQDLIRETEKWMSVVRREVAAWRKAGAAGASTPADDTSFAAFERKREDLALLLSNEIKGDVLHGRSIDVARSLDAAAERLLKDDRASPAQCASLESALRNAAAEIVRTGELEEHSRRRIDRHRAELDSLYTRQATRFSPQRTGDVRGTTLNTKSSIDAAIREAAQATLRQQLSEIAIAPASVWDELGKWAGALPTQELRQILAHAEAALARGDVEATESALAQALTRRHEVEQLAAANRQSAARLRSIADAVMQALCDRHYNTPVYGAVRDGDPLSAIQIRADVPSPDGRGNIRIELHADGRADFEVENVPTGEEEVCRAVIGRLAEAVAAEGMTLEMTDWGRATPAEQHEVQKSVKPVQIAEQMRYRPKERPNSREVGS